MAYLPNLTSKAKLVGRRYHPSAVSCFLHYDDDYLKHKPILPPSLHGSFLPQKRAFENSSSLFGLVRDRRSCSGFSNWTPRIGASPCRNFSDHVTAASDSFFPVAFFQHSIDAVHSLTGFNLWISLVLTTLIMRVTTLPIFINELKARPNSALWATNRINQLLDKVKKHPLIPHQVRSAVDGWRINVLPNEVSYPVKIWWFLVQASIHACFFLAVLKIDPELPRSFWGIPGENGAIIDFLTLVFGTQFIAEIFVYRPLDYIIDGSKALKKAKGADGLNKVALCTLFLLGLLVILHLPKGVVCYLATSKLFTLTFIRVVKYLGVNKALGILPKTNGKNTKI